MSHSLEREAGLQEAQYCFQMRPCSAGSHSDPRSFVLVQLRPEGALQSQPFSRGQGDLAIKPPPGWCPLACKSPALELCPAPPWSEQPCPQPGPTLGIRVSSSFLVCLLLPSRQLPDACYRASSLSEPKSLRGELTGRRRLGAATQGRGHQGLCSTWGPGLSPGQGLRCRNRLG